MAFGQGVLNGVFAISVFAFIFASPYLQGYYNRWQLTQCKESVASNVDQLEEVVTAYIEAEQRMLDTHSTLLTVMESVVVLVTDVQRRINQSKFIVNVLHEKGYAGHPKAQDEVERKFQLTMMKNVEDRLSETEKEISKQHDVIWKVFLKNRESRLNPPESTLRVRKILDLRYASQSNEYPPQKSSGVAMEAGSEGAAETEVPQDNSSDEDKYMRSLISLSLIGAELLVFCLVASVYRRYKDSHSRERMEENQDAVGNSRDHSRPLVAEVQDVGSACG